MADIKDFRNKNTKFTGTDGIVLPVGNTGNRPSGVTGETRYNSASGSIEFYDGANWISTNLIPSVSGVSGSIINGIATSITVTVVNGTEAVDVVYSEGGIEIARTEDATNSSGTVTVSVPAAVYGQTAGDVIAISVANQDGTPSSNSVNVTVSSSPSGGSISTSGNYRYHTFTTSGTFTNTISGLDVEYLIVAGGGGGGSADDGAGGGGGGGAGGAIDGTQNNLSVTGYSIVVGGPGQGGNRNASQLGANGSNSTGFGQTALGGGYGGDSGRGDDSDNGGGSGGGAMRSNTPGAGTAGQGNSGGTGTGGLGCNVGGGGGGGRGGNGGNTGGGAGANGGAGINWKSLGTSYAGGGGGGGHSGSGGSGQAGGGNGTASATQANNTDNGDANTGSGGGGTGAGTGTFYTGSNGGSGIVIIRYDITAI